jgi:hypothetical protein
VVALGGAPSRGTLHVPGVSVSRHFDDTHEVLAFAIALHCIAWPGQQQYWLLQVTAEDWSRITNSISSDLGIIIMAGDGMMRYSTI